MKDTKKHICKYFNTTNMTDVTICNDFFCCRRCGKILSDEMVDKSLQNKINKIRNKHSKFKK